VRLSERAKPQTAVLQAKGLHKTYHKAKQEIQVLRGASLKVHRGELLGVVGKSGSGKSTLLHLLGTLDKPDGGEVWFDGGRIDDLPARKRDALRNRRLGMIFQFYHLLPELTTLENVLSPLMITHGVLGWWSHRKKLVADAKELLDQVGLAHRLAHKPRELSGGELQRAAIARALVTNPEAVLADEPTGNLDPRTGGEIIALLRSLKDSRGLTIVMVTHDPAIAAQADRVVRLVEGKVEAE
jgi:lipoprotein-releasing system ATP-binding protein